MSSLGIRVRRNWMSPCGTPRCEPSRRETSHYECWRTAHDKDTGGRGLKPLGRTNLGKSGYALALAVLTAVLTTSVGAAAATPQRSIAHSAYGLQLSIPKP